MRAYFYLSKKRTNRKGVAPIYCRVCNDNDRWDFCTGISIAPAVWEANKWPDIEQYKAGERLNTILNKIYALISNMERTGTPTPKEIVYAYRNKKQQLISLQGVCTQYLACINVSLEVHQRIALIVSQFTEFTGIDNITRISGETLVLFEQEWLKRFSVSAYIKRARMLKRVFTYAVQAGYITSNPFVMYRSPKEPKKKLHQLTQVELSTLEQYKFSQKRLEQVKDLFLFQCYTGLAYIDLKSFSRSSLEVVQGVTFLKGSRQKTEEQYIAPWHPSAAAIVAKYNYQLPLLSNQKYNSYLKEVAEIAGIEKQLTTHVGRRTFAQIMLDKGYSMEAVSRMVGHASFAVTQKHYARISETRVVNEVLKNVA